MLRPEERKWWPAAPLLLAEGLWVRLRSDRLPAAGSPRGSVGAGQRRLRLLGLGDSIIAGIGCADQREALLGLVAAELARRAGATVEWVALGESGRASGDVTPALLDAARSEQPDLVIISLGVNDAVAGVDPARFKQGLQSVIDGLAGTRSAPGVVFAGVPRVETFPALPWPLSRLLGARADRLAEAAQSLAGYRGLKVVVMPREMPRAGFARDGFHPGPAGCAAWARWVADGFALALD